MYDIFFIGSHKASWEKLKEKYPNAQHCGNASIKDLQKKSFTKLFWLIPDDVELLDSFNLSEYKATKWDDMYVHVFKNGNAYDGIALVPKNIEITNREFRHRFYVSKKEVDQQASCPLPYEIFEVKTFEDYERALTESQFEMFWIVPTDVEVDPTFKFDYYITHHEIFDRNINHVFQNIFRNEPTYTGVMLMSKNKKVSSKEINFRFLIEKKEHEIVASKTKPYDIVFVSYFESNADKNFKLLLDNLDSKSRNVYRINGIKGIHQAHIEAAKLAQTDMFWVVDADAVIEDTFKFDYEVSRYELNIVHVWRSRNPVNGLEYGNGGIKLLPRQMTIDMDMSKPDMTTSISKWFKAMPEISNVTEFNTDPFNTWKSAFRECVKLSSKVIDRQNHEETIARLTAWLTYNPDVPFGKEAAEGAYDGREYGRINKDNLEALNKINDFAWLEERFRGR